MNTEKTLATKKYYTTRMSSCVERQHTTEGYVIRLKDKPAHFENSRFFKPEKDKVFIKGTGWVKPKPNQIEKVTFKKVESYQDMLELVNQYGYRCAAEMVGFQLSSYGDHYPISDIAKMETYGTSYIEWLEKIAELDYQMLQYFSQLKVTIRNDNYDMWMQGEGEGQLTFRNNPFFGMHIQTCLFGMFPITPGFDPVSWDSALRKAVFEFHPDYSNVDFSDSIAAEDAHQRYDSVSCMGWVKIMCGEDNANWLQTNLHFKGVPIVRETILPSAKTKVKEA